ncbi:site-2 protease family protein [Lyngbya confervoides]|uniref:Site-2 protease family protein n=1 Tax=Lyngbya confervoides BDU141951 TaxID=1574623 RepID=A0ABD4T003_9CYAN|nr:site-2 protease family protein [Lyngbya confervoides]MCM1981715.1 site-2 protease family protein [Lyngbya confervoides BDU141951]
MIKDLSPASLIWTTCVFTGFVLSVCLHEFGHALVAYWGGDRSVKEKGYLTLNPLKYTHPTYSIAMPLLFLLLGGLPLPGAAVYINMAALRSRAWRSAVAAAGPLATIGVAGAIALVLHRLSPNYEWVRFQAAAAQQLSLHALTLESWLILGLLLLLTLEVAGAVLNLMPIPGLDGYGILEPWLPGFLQQQMRQFARYGIWILFAAFWLIPDFSRGFWTLVYGLVNGLGAPPEMSSLSFYLFRQGAQVILLILLGIWILFNQWKKRQSPV